MHYWMKMFTSCQNKEGPIKTDSMWILFIHLLYVCFGCLLNSTCQIRLIVIAKNCWALEPVFMVKNVHSCWKNADWIHTSAWMWNLYKCAKNMHTALPFHELVFLTAKIEVMPLHLLKTVLGMNQHRVLSITIVVLFFPQFSILPNVINLLVTTFKDILLTNKQKKHAN